MVFVRIGGSINIEGRTIRATSNYYPPLQINSQYLIFAVEITKTGSYTSPNPHAVFVLDDKAGATTAYSGDIPRLSRKTASELLHSGICK